MVKGKHDTITLSIAEVRNIFIAGSEFGEHTLKEDMDMDMADEEEAVDFGEFMNLHHAIELS